MNSVEILSVSGYRKAILLRENVEQALRELNMNLKVKEVTDVNDMIKSEISGIPALRVNNKVVVQKVVPAVEDLKILLKTMLEPSYSPLQIKKILVPTDFSDTARGAYEFAMELAKKKGAELQLIHWFHQELDPAFPFISSNTDAYVESKKALLEGCKLYAEALPDSDIQITTDLQPGFATQEIVKMSSTSDVDLIVMGTTGEGGFLNKLFGSVSSHVARNAHCPVLLIPKGATFEGFNNILYASNYHTYDEAMLQKVVEIAFLV